ncbi:MAG: DUF3134 domain-containing protein [Nostocales cyanobacterium 94392]|uniref:DUF3134 domain-containing protein n=1 Tax=Plectonema cf. radiosum LEGE 06105 TaxID=945769 RepID=A0A8J7FIL4_9CYAN|nr:DUF3134 domain-containing protein [Plectonema radiosum]MBE9214406.1 DUF3134 domain-containing protein [Plectonema cf. radiosum LEGE 06105]MBF2017425.1 DUF3134 domain-containing protein [Rivularia sp. T60_A2020_040]MEB3216084.1 DUF3134 domain-containing protein [Nostocales cyanobacterium 94392]
MLNSPLYEVPRSRRASVIPLKQEPSLLDWLQANGRLISRDPVEPQVKEQEQDINSLMGIEEGVGDYEFDDDDDDDDVIPDEE